MNSLDTLFEDIKQILSKYSNDFKTVDEYLRSKAKNKKPGFHLYGKKDVSLFGKTPQPTYLAGVIQQKNYVSFYFSPIYSHPELTKEIPPELKKSLKGKSCFNIKKSSLELLSEIENTLLLGIKKYKEIKWV